MVARKWKSLFGVTAVPLNRVAKIKSTSIAGRAAVLHANFYIHSLTTKIKATTASVLSSASFGKVSLSIIKNIKMRGKCRVFYLHE